MLYLKRHMLLLMGLGFAAGFPFMLIGLSLTARLTDAGLSKSSIGLFALVGLPYAWKVLWSPALQYLPSPFFRRLHQRRGWAMCLQIALITSTLTMAVIPNQAILSLAIIALLIAFFSASFDIILDAYRIERLKDNEQAAGAVMYVNGYRIGMLVAGSGTVVLSSHLPWQYVLMIAAAVQCIGLLFILIAKPVRIKRSKENIFSLAALKEPLKALITRFSGWQNSLYILLIPVTYKLADSYLSVMNYPFLITEVGISKELYSGIVQTAGLFIAIAGSLLGGWLALRISLVKFLLIGSVLQMLSNLGYLLLYHYGANINLLTAVIAIEELTGGIGSAALFALIALLCDKRFTAIHFALITSIIAIFRQLVAATSGFAVDYTNWPIFFIISALMALPAIVLIMANRGNLQKL